MMPRERSRGCSLTSRTTASSEPSGGKFDNPDQDHSREGAQESIGESEGFMGV